MSQSDDEPMTTATRGVSMKETEILLCGTVAPPGAAIHRQGSNGMRWRIVLLAISLCPQVLVAQAPAPTPLEVPYGSSRSPTGSTSFSSRHERAGRQRKRLPTSAPRTNGSGHGPGTPVRASDVRRLRSRRGGAFDTLLEAAGASSNGSTDLDRTNYFIDLPANALELALFLESDRMAYCWIRCRPSVWTASARW